MRCALILSLLSLISLHPSAQQHIPFSSNTTPTWQQTIDRYTQLAETSEWAKLEEIGVSDAGKPIHLFSIRKKASKKKVTLLINNAIHPGEPCGVDASLIFAEELLTGGEIADSILQNIDVCIIPMYNIGGALNRGCCSRANQNGPEEYGFRGNARNLDLNRDFIKCDSENARVFSALFQRLKPNVFVDTHTTNGADYRYVMTLISTQPDKAGKITGTYIRETLEPALYKAMERNKYPMTPYVNTLGDTPETGIVDFLETPRFSTGYAALFNCIGFTAEAHMFKPYSERVEATYWLLRSLAEFMAARSKELIELKQAANRETMTQSTFPLRWEADTTRYTDFNFKGYEAIRETSEVTGKQRLRYDREKPRDFVTRWYHWYTPSRQIEAPHAYLIPQAWKEVIERLSLNQVRMERLVQDENLQADTYYIEEFDSPRMPYEGHYLHRNTKANPISIQAEAYRGDYLVRTDQLSNRYIVETLEPEGMDSFLAWNFFDSILQQKEWFSDYIFEEEAEALLQSDPELRAEFERMKAEREDFRNDAFAQLYYLYRNSPNYESTHNLYPVLRLSEGEYERIQKEPIR